MFWICGDAAQADRGRIARDAVLPSMVVGSYGAPSISRDLAVDHVDEMAAGAVAVVGVTGSKPRPRDRHRRLETLERGGFEEAKARKTEGHHARARRRAPEKRATPDLSHDRSLLSRPPPTSSCMRPPRELRVTLALARVLGMGPGTPSGRARNSRCESDRRRRSRARHCCTPATGANDPTCHPSVTFPPSESQAG